ncbi:MAG: GntR family transcriptional regulator, partial [Tumebacillaceae bacterium]
VGEEFTGNAPIYMQIVQKLCAQIVRGDIKPGEKLPSVRELAVQYGVNPNTVQRVYMEMERLAVVEARRGQGTFVTEVQERLQQLRDDLKHEKIETFVNDMQAMGFAADEVARGLADYLQQHKGGTSHE